MDDEFLDGLTLEQRVDKTREIFERILRDGRLCEFEPEAHKDGEFSAYFFGCTFDCFACTLVVDAPGRSHVKAECYIDGRVKHAMPLFGEHGLNYFVERMAAHVGHHMRGRAQSLFVQQRVRRIEIRSAIEGDPASLGLVRVKTYQYGITSWKSLLNQRGHPTVHVVANDENGNVRDVATLVFTCPHAPAIWATCQLRVDTLHFMWTWRCRWSPLWSSTSPRWIPRLASCAAEPELLINPRARSARVTPLSRSS